MPAAADDFDQLVKEVHVFWLNNRLAGYDVTDYDRDDNAFWRSRAMTIEDAIIGLEKQKNGEHVSSIDFGYLPPNGVDPVLVAAIRALVPDYEPELEDRDAEAARDYAEHGDMVA